MTDPPLILNVDDYDPARYARTQVLRRAGFRVSEAATGGEALRLASREQPAVVLLDVNLPDMSGLEVCRRLRHHPEIGTVAVLHLSATAIAEGDRVVGLESGADGYLVEPVSPTVLVATVNALLRARRAEDALRAAMHDAEAARGEAEAANRAKDTFLATLSHELRSPLNTTLGWTRMLRSGALDPVATARALDTIERCVRAQAKLIDDLLDVSRIISGAVRIDQRPVDAVAVIAGAIDAVRPDAQARGVRLTSELDPRTGLVRADPDRLQQIASNLLANALKFTPRGGHVDVRLERLPDTIRLVVGDDGIGIEADFLPHVFDRFRQAETGPSSVTGGLGLGLAIVRHLVEVHGGTVTADSPGPGQGATFTVTLPLG